MENRHFARAPVHAQQKLLCLSDKNHFEKNIVVSKNLSASGFCFRSARPFENGKIVFVYLAEAVLEDIKINRARVMKAGNYFMARVVWCRPADANNSSTASKASERGRLHPALPVEGATQAPVIDPFLEVGCSFVPMTEGNGESVSLFTRFVNHFTADALAH